MKQYLDLIRHVLENGKDRTDRTGTGTRSVFGYHFRHDLRSGFPLVTTKAMKKELFITETLWFLRGDTNIQYLLRHNNHIWDEWAFKNYVESGAYTGPDMTDFGLRAEKDPEFKRIYKEEMKKFTTRILRDDAFAAEFGDLGPVYGKQWRAWPIGDGQTLDQIQRVVESIKKNPDSRRHIVAAWNPAEVDDMALPPCHALFQFYVEDGRLSCQLYQRSADIFLGVPFNIASYALLTHMIAQACDLGVGEFIHTFGDAHIYHNHFEQVKTQITREPHLLPRLRLNPDVKILEAFRPEDITIENYVPYAPLRGSVSV